MNSIYDCYTLSNGVQIPCIGYGTYKAADGKDIKILKTAIEAGYRYFDTASFYGTEKYLGQAIKESGIDRREFFITSKAWKDQMGYEEALCAFQESLEMLQTDYLDMYLVHWPKPEPDTKNWESLDIETWKALEKLYAEQKVRAIGVSNFLPHHIENLLLNCQVKPMTNQLEFHPGYTQEVAVAYCKKQGILVQAWSPIGRSNMLKDPLILELGTKYHVSAAQICLRYEIQKGVIPLPKTSSMERMKQNQDLFSFEISQLDMYRLDTMPPTSWLGEHPDRERIIV
ncbi:MAG: aldo/keto reductase [Lachnospiraceae bacterium]